MAGVDTSRVSPDTQRLLQRGCVDFQPVFILGSHRSGTSILYKVLAESGCFNVVTAFHVLNRHRLLAFYSSGTMELARVKLAEISKKAGLGDEYGRPVTPDSLEEYCFALGHQGHRPALTAANYRSFVDFCCKLQLIRNPTRPLLLKNPYDTRQFVLIHQAFPKARFVFEHSNSVQVIDSQLRLIRQIMSQRVDYDVMALGWCGNIYDNAATRRFVRCICSEKLLILFQLVFDNVSRNCDYGSKNFDPLGTSAIGVTYSQLCQHPAEAVDSVLGPLGLKEQCRTDYARFIRPRQSGLLPEVEGAGLRSNCGTGSLEGGQGQKIGDRIS